MKIMEHEHPRRYQRMLDRISDDELNSMVQADIERMFNVSRYGFTYWVLERGLTRREAVTKLCESRRKEAYTWQR